MILLRGLTSLPVVLLPQPARQGQGVLTMKWLLVFLTLLSTTLDTCTAHARGTKRSMIDIQKTAQRLQDHLKALTVTIGERSIRFPENIERAAQYIESFYRDIGIPSQRKPYQYQDLEVANIVAELSFSENPSTHYLLVAHYDSVANSVGADDNASAVAVQLETARLLKALKDTEKLDLAVTCVSFALEEPPVFNTPHMGSRIYAKKVREERKKIDGIICLEMVGYSCHDPGCQSYPFPLMFLGYPKEGNFIGIVGNWKSRGFADTLFRHFRENKALPVVKLTVPLGGWALPAVRMSDHASFWDEGFKAVMITDSAFYRNPNYHRPTDTMEKLDYRFMAELVESLLIFFRAHQR